ncbi:MAG: hypothetical protein ACFB9M_19025 [Myxococcota bacterium]
MRAHARTIQPTETFDDEVLGRFLDQAEYALLSVESREDRPYSRSHGEEMGPSRTQELEQALAELADCYPGLSAELDDVSERARCCGVQAAVRDLEALPHLLHFVRLSLEVFFRQFPTAEAYEMKLREEEAEGCDEDQDCHCAQETFETQRRLLDTLRGWVN